VLAVNAWYAEPGVEAQQLFWYFVGGQVIRGTRRGYISSTCEDKLL